MVYIKTDNNKLTVNPPSQFQLEGSSNSNKNSSSNNNDNINNNSSSGQLCNFKLGDCIYQQQMEQQLLQFSDNNKLDSSESSSVVSAIPASSSLLSLSTTPSSNVSLSSTPSSVLFYNSVENYTFSLLELIPENNTHNHSLNNSTMFINNSKTISDSLLGSLQMAVTTATATATVSSASSSSASSSGADSAGADAIGAAAATHSYFGNLNETYWDFDEDFDFLYRHSLLMTVVYCIAYIIVFIVGLVGNSFVIAVVLRAPRMRTVTNYFIVNLAIADILVIVFCLPATLMSNIFVPWVLGWLMCKTVPYIQGVSVAASVYSLIAVSLDRFIAIWWPLKQMTKSRARFMIFCIWIIALGSTIPWVLFFDLVPATEVFPTAPEMYLCQEVWPPGTNGNLYFLLAHLVACYLLPMSLITLCYVLIWIKVSTRSIPGDSKDAQMDRMQQKSKVKVIKMLVAVVILFVLSWLPLYVIFARIKFGGEITQEESEILNKVTPIAQWLGSSNSCINPILYAFFNKKYRRGFAAIVKSRSCCGRLRYYDNVTMASSSTSTRKSSQYQNNNSSKKSPGSPGMRKPKVVSYIYSYNEHNTLRKHNLIIKQDSNLSQQMLLKQDSQGSRQMLIKQESASSDGSRQMLCKQDSNGSKLSLSKQDSVISYIETRRGQIFQNDRDSFSTQDTISIDSSRGTPIKQDTQYSCIETRRNGSVGGGGGVCGAHISDISNANALLEFKRKKLVKQDSVISFADQKPEPRRHQLVKQDSIISFADQKRGFLCKQDSLIATCPNRTGDAFVQVSILKKTDSLSSNGTTTSSPRKNIEFSE